MATPYQPFLISQYQTGLFNYLQPWISPTDAFSPMQNANVYRGTVQKRNGYTYLGQMQYTDLLTVGTGITTYSGTLSLHPIVPGSFDIIAGTQTMTDNGLGVLAGAGGSSGTINYTTGAWTLSFGSNVPSGTNIYAEYQLALATPRPIMGIKSWTNESNGGFTTVIMDTRRLSYFNTATGDFNEINAVKQVLWVSDGSTTSIVINTGWTAVSPYTNAFSPFSISITDGTSTIVDDGAGNLSSSGNFSAGGMVNYATGAITLKYAATPAFTITLSATLVGDYFTGNASNFFNTTNWFGYLYMTNNVDPITRYNGTTNTLDRPPFPTLYANISTFTNNIGTCLDIDVYKNRMTFQLPTLINQTPSSANGPQGQSIFWSALNNPTNVAVDVSGNGGFLVAPTDDFIESSEFLRDQLIVFFEATGWLFRYTGNDFDPFRFDKINNTKTTNAPYGTIPYDERVTAMGNKGLTATDGVNFQRYDAAVVDQFLDINPDSFAQSYGLRFDTLNQSWMLYPSVDNGASVSDKALIYNFIENTWSVYDLPMSCLGTGLVNSDETWESFAPNTPLGTQFPNWSSCDFPWNEYLIQAGALNLLGGGHDGNIYVMDDGNQDLGGTDLQAPFPASITTTKWNPFVAQGQKVQFGYIDFYYEVESDVGLLPESVLALNFYVDNSENSTLTKQLWLDGPSYAETAMKRVYINLVGEFLQMEIDSNYTLVNFNGIDQIVEPGPFKILGMVLWARPSGRLTP